MIFYLAAIIYGGGGIGGSLGMYIARYNLNNEGMLAAISLLAALPMIVTSFFLPLIIKKVDKFTVFFWSIVIGTALGIIAFFVGYKNLPLYLGMLFLRGIASGFMALLAGMFTPDMVEYGYYKTGIPASGITFSIQTFSAKLQAALATALGALFLSLIGFVEGEGAVQAEGFADKLWFINAIDPAIMSCIAIPVLSRYKLRDKKVMIMSQYNNGEITREEAEKRLGGEI
jgi:Na+/melibiose symporter-like transporter